MSRTAKLMSYFQAVDDAADEPGQSLAVGEGFLRHSNEFEKRLQQMLRDSQPRPDTHEGMLYQVGVRDGLQMVQSLIDGIRASVLETKNDRSE